jgi:Fe-S cluster biogenesis protein NfuA
MSSEAAPANERLARVLAEEVAPALAMDGAALELVAIDRGVVQLRLRGGCMTCPSTIMALVLGVEQELRRRVPEVEYVEVVP